MDVYLNDGNLLVLEKNDNQGIKEFMDGDDLIKEFQVKKFHCNINGSEIEKFNVNVKINKSAISYIVG